MSYDTIECAPSDPQTQWFFALLIFSFAFFGLFILYFAKILGFRCKTPETPWSYLSRRFVFCLTLIIKTISLCLQAAGFYRAVNFSVFKYAITDFPYYLNCVAYFSIFQVWMKAYSSHVKRQWLPLFWSLEHVTRVFNGLCLLLFFCLFLTRCIIEPEHLRRWSSLSNVLPIVPEAVLCVAVSCFLILLRLLVKVRFVCDLGNPSNYLITISLILAIATLVTIATRIVLLALHWDLDGCEETRLIFRVFYEGFGVFLPFGFISVIDILRAPQVEDFSTEVNFGISSVV
jgi:hypothetical protein